MSGKLRLLAIFGLVTGVLVAGAAPSAFASTATHHYPPPPTPDCSVIPTTVHPGQVVTLIGNHWHHFATVNIFFQQSHKSTNIANGHTGNDGRFVTHGRIPGWAKSGPANVIFNGRRRGHHGSFTCVVPIHVTKKHHHHVASSNAGYAVTPMGFVPVLFLGAMGLLYVERRRRHRRLFRATAR